MTGSVLSPGPRTSRRRVDRLLGSASRAAGARVRADDQRLPRPVDDAKQVLIGVLSTFWQFVDFFDEKLKPPTKF